MPDPSLDRATLAVGELRNLVGRLLDEVVESESLRAQKIRLIQQALYVLVPSVVLLIIMAITNFALLAKTRDAAADARATNQLIAGCLQPNTSCSNANASKMGDALNQIRQTQFVISVCMRQNPTAEDPAGKKMIKCVQAYYPNFSLPPKIG